MTIERAQTGRLRPNRAVVGILAGCSLAAGLGYSSTAFAGSTGAFTSPLTQNVVLSVDINGGIIASNNATTEGSNGPSGSPTLSADPFGVTWAPWGGPTSTNGDGTQLPDSQASPTNAASGMTKNFGGIGITISESGTASNYATVSSVESMNSRDRGTPSGAANDGDLFRDFIFAGGSGSNVQSTNFLQVSITGLTPNTAYLLAGYSYDSSSTGNKEDWTAMPPSVNPTIGTHWGYNPDPTDVFTAPSDELTQSFSSVPAEAVFTVMSDGSGDASLWTWGGDGVTGDQGSQSSYINGLQIALAPVPEPASLGLVAIAGASLLGRRRSRAI